MSVWPVLRGRRRDTARTAGARARRDRRSPVFRGPRDERSHAGGLDGRRRDRGRVGVVGVTEQVPNRALTWTQQARRSDHPPAGEEELLGALLGYPTGL
jgi:hypothetical protein